MVIEFMNVGFTVSVGKKTDLHLSLVVMLVLGCIAFG